MLLLALRGKDGIGVFLCCLGTDMILYALIVQQSAGVLFAGGVIPTILLPRLDITYIH